MTDDLDIPYLPYDSDANTTTPQKPGAAVLGDAPFKYIGQAHTVDSFAAYCAMYDFGRVPPDYVVLHHTANPDASWAPLNSNPKIKWDRSEAGATDAQIKTKRKAQLDAIMRYYRDEVQNPDGSKGWDRGPHLFIDDRYIWLFTPMYDVGIHASSGNSYRDSKKRLHYSIGIEVVGYYEKVRWPPMVARNVAGAVAVLAQKLRTFGYIDKPWAGGISSHRNYNKPSCPGAAITPDYYMPVLKAAWKELAG